jgi:hypothetical protein
MRRRFASSIAFLVLLLLLPSTGQARKTASRSPYLMYVGTYTGPDTKGIYAYRFDAATGEATPIGLVAWTILPRKSRCTLTENSSIARTAATTASQSSPSTRQPACSHLLKPSQPVARSRAA